MPSHHDLLRSIPKVDELLSHPALFGSLSHSHQAVADAVRGVLADLRAEILGGQIAAVPDLDALIDAVHQRLKANSTPSLKKLINATGIVLHTNLGRAPLPNAALEAVQRVSEGYSNLEYSIEGGERGSRHSHVSALLCALTGAEDAMVLNNNAGAVLLMLAALVGGMETVISRGELVEIGGAFRVPDVMRLSGSILKEVGTTNKTHLADYESAIEEGVTGALLKVHTSNFKIMGFTEEVDLSSLVALGQKYGLPVLYDLGSGFLLPMGGIKAPRTEPTVLDSVKSGADVVCFSGDKLLGGPQAGIVLGKKSLIGKMKKHPLARALRIDKMTLAALEATLRLYQDPDVALREVPVLRMLSSSKDALIEKAGVLISLLHATPSLKAEIVESEGQVGGGSAPGEVIPSIAVSVEPLTRSVMELEKALREKEPPIIARIFKDRLLIDMLTVEKSDLQGIAASISDALTGAKGV